MKKYKTYILDFDGTLVDSIASLTIMYKKGFEARNIPFKDEDAKIYMKEGLDITGKRFGIVGDDYIAWGKIFDTLVDSKEVIEANKAFPDTEDFIKRINNSDKKFAVVTGNSGAHVKDVLNYLKIPLNTDVYIGCLDIKHNKPDPEGILLALSRLGVGKEDAVYVGDAINDVIAAHNAGIESIFLMRHPQALPDLPFTLIHSLSEIEL